jgi:hypothetical protein
MNIMTAMSRSRAIFLTLHVVILVAEPIGSNNRGESKTLKRIVLRGTEEESIVALNSHHCLNTTLCKDYCETCCISYITPLNSCFNPQTLFPRDESWGEGDVLDGNVTFSSDDGQVSFVRTFYSTNDSTSGGLYESEILPLNECVGPFGAPRPWGIFELSSSKWEMSPRRGFTRVTKTVERKWQRLRVL